MTVSIVPIYAAILALIFTGLSLRTLTLRRRLKVGIGTGDNQPLTRAIRAHGNFQEYTPLALVLILLLELTSPGAWVHVAGIALVAGRSIHAYGVSQEPENYRFRVAGMVLTLFVLISTSLRLLF